MSGDVMPGRRYAGEKQEIIPIIAGNAIGAACGDIYF